MFGMGISELLLISVIAIIFLGPEKLPAFMVSVGKFINKAKKSLDEVKDTIDKEIKLDEIKELKDDAKKFKGAFTEKVLE